MFANHCVDILGLKVFSVKKNVTIFYNLQSLYKFKSRKKCYLSPQYRQHNNEINKTSRNIAFLRIRG